MAPAQYRFKDLSATTFAVPWLLAAALLVQFAMLPIFFFDPEWLGNALRLPSWARAGLVFAQSRSGEIVLAVVFAVTFLTGLVLALRWIYLANANAHALGAEGMRFTPGWAVGWYFVPIANLWKPYQAMKEIWQASAVKTDWRVVRVPRLLPWWWAFWLLSTSISIGPIDSDDPDQRIAALVFLLILFSLLLGAFVTFVTISARIWAMQRQRREFDARGAAPM